MTDPNRNDLFEATPNLFWYWESWVSKRFDRNGNEMKIGSLKR